MKQLVSILIPAFNAEKWIGDCIESALAQTWRWKEIIVVDDGSKDSTLKIAKSYASPIVHVTTQENRGASAARNQALSLSQGNYIQWLDADDLLAPDKIARQLNDLETDLDSRVLLSSAWGKFHQRHEKSKFAPNSLWEDLEPKEWLFRKLDENLWMSTMAWLVSRTLTEMAGPWNESLNLDDDGEYFCRILYCCYRIRFIPEARCFKRTTFGLSHDLTLSNRKLDSLSISLLSHIRTLRKMEDSPRTRSACLKYLQRWAIYFYPERPDIMHRMQSMATELGGQLNPPQLRSKYRLLQKIFGWRIAKKAQFSLPALRTLTEKTSERILYFLST